MKLSDLRFISDAVLNLDSGLDSESAGEDQDAIFPLAILSGERRPDSGSQFRDKNKSIPTTLNKLADALALGELPSPGFVNPPAVK
jgi:hypothetical protein